MFYRVVGGLWMWKQISQHFLAIYLICLRDLLDESSLCVTNIHNRRLQLTRYLENAVQPMSFGLLSQIKFLLSLHVTLDIGSNLLSTMMVYKKLICICHITYVCLCFGSRIYIFSNLSGDSSTVNVQAKKNFIEEPSKSKYLHKLKQNS